MVVPTRDRPELLDGCLESLRGGLRPTDELIVVDSGSTSEAVREVALAHGGRYLRCDHPGASLARNTGWRNAANQAVAFIDDDVRVSAGWADAMRRHLGGADGPCFVTGRVGMPEGQWSERPVALLEREEPTEVTAETRVAHIGHSANLGVRRSAMELVGGFDEQLGAGGRFRAAEDIDLFDRLLAQGCTGFYDPAVQAWHEQWRARPDFLQLDWGYGIGMGARMAKLARTNPGRLWYAAHTTFWVWGVKDAIDHARAGHTYVAAAALVRMAGAVAGLALALPGRLRDGHFVSPR